MRPARRRFRCRVERRVEARPPVGAGQQHRLAQRRPAGDRHCQHLSVIKADKRACRAFDIEMRLRQRRRADQPRPAIKQHHSRQQRIAANVPDRPAAPGRHIAHIALGLRRIGEGGGHMRAGAEVEAAKPVPLRVVAHHIAVIEIESGARRHRGQPVELFHRQRHRLLADHRLAGFQRGDAHRHVQMVGKRVVDGVDIGVGQHLLIG